MDENQRVTIRNLLARRKALSAVAFYLVALVVVWGMSAGTGWRLPLAVFVPVLLGGAVANFAPLLFGINGYRLIGWLLLSVWSGTGIVLALAFDGNPWFVGAGMGNAVIAAIWLVLYARERRQRGRL